MKPDDTVCYCFRVTRRKLVNFARQHPLRVASQLSGCGGAGTGCGWCVPVLKRIFENAEAELDALDAADQARGRAAYLEARPGRKPEDAP